MAPIGYTTGGSGSRRQASPSTDLTRSGTAAASALADMFSPPKPQAPIPSPTSTVGQSAARTMTPWVAEAIAPAVNTMNRFMQQAEDEGWIGIVNEEDPEDQLFIPASFEGRMPDHYQVIGPVHHASRDHELSIYSQPPEIQAAFGISQGLGASDPKDVRPTDTGLIQMPPSLGISDPKDIRPIDTDLMVSVFGEALGRLGTSDPKDVRPTDTGIIAQAPEPTYISGNDPINPVSLPAPIREKYGESIGVYNAAITRPESEWTPQEQTIITNLPGAINAELGDAGLLATPDVGVDLGAIQDGATGIIDRIGQGIDTARQSGILDLVDVLGPGVANEGNGTQILPDTPTLPGTNISLAEAEAQVQPVIGAVRTLDRESVLSAIDNLNIFPDKDRLAASVNVLFDEIGDVWNEPTSAARLWTESWSCPLLCSPSSTTPSGASPVWKTASSAGSTGRRRPRTASHE